MKKVLTFLFAVTMCVVLRAQTVDYELLGFLNGNDEVIYDLVLDANQDFEPRIMLKNNGPDVPAAADSIIFDIYYNGNYASYFYVQGINLHSIEAGQTGTIALPRALWTAAQMDAYMMTAFQICFEVRIAGSATDPDISNNEACVQVNRPLDVAEYGKADMKVWPNPTSGMVWIAAPEQVHGDCTVSIYDMFGKRLAQEKMETGTMTLDLCGFASGIYIVRVENGSEVIATEKVAKR